MLTFIYLVAITAEAMSGALAAGRRSMDIFGVAVVAFVTALGGGTVRDLILGHYPIGWTQHPPYIYLVIGAGLLTIVVAPYMHRLKRTFLVLDALGLVAFSLIGCDVALQMNYPVAVVIMAGMITGIGALKNTTVADAMVIYATVPFVTAALAYLDFRLPQIDWRAQAPGLSAWLEINCRC